MTKYPFKSLLPYLRGQTSRLAAAYACMTALAFSSALLAFLSGPALQFVFTGNLSAVLQNADGQIRTMWRMLPEGILQALLDIKPSYSIWIVPLMLVATAIIKGFAQTGQFYFLGKTSQAILQAIRHDAFEALLRQNSRFFIKHAHGDLVSRLTHDAGVVEQALFYGCGPILRDTLGVVVLLGFCIVIDPWLSLVTLVTLPLAVVPLARFSRWLKKVSQKGQSAQGRINAVCHQSLSGISVVQACQGESRELQQLDAAASHYAQQMTISYFIRAVRTPTMEALGSFALAGLLALLGYRVQHQGADPAHFISFFAAIVMMYDPLKKLGNVSDYLAAGHAALERLFEIMHHPAEIQDSPHSRPIAHAPKKLVFEQVGFHYTAQRPILRQLDFCLEAGTSLALVGPSGAGKTTLASLIPRFYDVTEGSIRLDGHDIRDITLNSLRAQISIVGQDTFLFNRSVRENIAYGRPDAQMEQIKQAAESAYAANFIQDLPQGYETILGERGLTLSGGQRQRLAIARAFLRDAPILILDEATSHLDVESEQAIQAALTTLLVGRTSLIIAHRLSTVRHADRIAVLQHGRIAEYGTHRELLRTQGAYARLHDIQFSIATATQQTSRSPG